MSVAAKVTRTSFEDAASRIADTADDSNPCQDMSTLLLSPSSQVDGPAPSAVPDQPLVVPDVLANDLSKS